MPRFDDIELDNADGAGIRIAVVDSGVATGHPHLPANAVAEGVRIDGHNESADFADQLGHGTAVAAAIHEKVPAAALLIVRVFVTRLSTSPATLVRAIDWSIDNGANLINLSLGTANPLHEQYLNDAVQRAAAASATVVAAGESHGVRWLPGSIRGALGVVADPDCPRDQMRTHGVAGHVTASPHARPIAGVPLERNLAGTSFAVANATGLSALLLATGHGGLLRRLLTHDRAAVSHTRPPRR